MMTSSQYFERSKLVAPGGVHSPVRAFKSVGGDPIFFKSAQGAYIESVEGDKFIDFCQSFGPNILGHRDPDVAVVVKKMVDVAWSLGACEPYSLELAEWMVERLPFVDKVRFVCSGTEAVMSALRVARAATNREKVLKFNGCYHGHVDNMLVKAGSGLAGESASDSAGVTEADAHHTLVADLDDIEGLKKVFVQYGHEIAAVILEPLPANFGLLKQQEEFIQSVFELCKKHEALVIFDEVISGFRVGLGGMAEQLGVEPDLVTYGKIIGGGFPVGCYAGKMKYMDLVAPMGPVYQAGTLAANPIGMCAGLATLKKVVSENIYETLAVRTLNFCNQLNEEFEQKDIPLQVIHEGSLFWIYSRTNSAVRSVKDFVPNHADTFKELFHACLQRGVYLAPSGYEVGFISYAHTDEILKAAKNKIVDAAIEVYKA